MPKHQPISAMPNFSSFTTPVTSSKSMPAFSCSDGLECLYNAQAPPQPNLRFHNAFVSNNDKRHTMNAMKDACRSLGVVDIFCEEHLCQARGRYFAADHAATDFDFSVYSTEFKGATRNVVQVNKGSGCRIAFSTFMSNLIKLLKSRDEVLHTEISEAVWDPRTCPSDNPFMLETETDRVERLEKAVPACLMDCESGYATRILEDAPRLARYSDSEESRKVLKDIPNIIDRMIKMMEGSFESVLVRSILICLINMCDGDEDIVRLCCDNHQLTERLNQLRTRWENVQFPFGESFPHAMVDPSPEVTSQVERAIEQLS